MSFRAGVQVNGLGADARGGASLQVPRRTPRNSISTSEQYDRLKRDLLSKNQLFEDPEFPATDTSIFYSKRPPKPFQWKRPKEIAKDAQMFVGGADRFDVVQGDLGDCWLLAAVASLSMYPELFDQVVPKDEDFKKDYCGMFKFRFWQFGEWIDVIIDDRLPTYNNQLVFMHSKSSNEFWSALLEKAYTKLFGSYEALKGGSSSEAMEDFTGGVTEFFDLKVANPEAHKHNTFEIMKRSYQKCSLMGCSIDADPSVVEAKLSNGLIKGHAYSITGVKIAKLNNGGEVQLIRIRNPWGNADEWKGAWSDSSREWEKLSPQDKNSMLKKDDDGEFWMSFQDFTAHFEKLEICQLAPDSSLYDGEIAAHKRRWESTQEIGHWKKKVNAGGCRNFLNTFWTNPQFRMEVVDADDNDKDNTGTVIIGLLQKDMRKKKKEGLELFTIGYTIYNLPSTATSAPLDLNFFKYNSSIARSPSFINQREVCGRHKLTPGHYVIMPSTFEPDEDCKFLLRVFSEKKAFTQQLDHETKKHEAKVPVAHKESIVGQDQKQLEALRVAFQKISGDDMEVDAFELRDILNASFRKEFKFEGFSIEATRSMVAIMDDDRSGKLGFEEFNLLWTDLRLWKSVFKQFDDNKSGTFDCHELRKALSTVGYSVNNKLFHSLVIRYSTKEGEIMFDDFITCCCRLKKTFEVFENADRLSDGRAAFNHDEFLNSMIYV